MAGSSLLALIDDIASILDDVSILTKVAVKKTSGVLGDDLALNAEQVSGIHADRELPVVWAVAKGSLVNKAILVPSALVISAFFPSLIMPMLMLGGLYLCYEGFEKVFEKVFHKKTKPEALVLSLSEADKIKGAVRTDFVLSSEIVVITLGTVGETSLLHQVLVLTGISILMTVGVYGLVAGIVKLDDLGLVLLRRDESSLKAIGRYILLGAPFLMRALGVIGTVAMFMVGGGILMHGLPEGSMHLPAMEGSSKLVLTVIESILGLVAGGLAFSAKILVKGLAK